MKVINRCNDAIDSPFLVHRVLKRMSSKKGAKEKEHYTQLTSDYISRAFSMLRDKTGLFSELDPKNRPTFHEIRSLGIALYKDAGIDPQALAGHTNPKMTNEYQKGHNIKWTHALADLIID